RHRASVAVSALLAVAFVALVLPGPLASAGAVPTASASTVPGPSESWAWGALANFSASVQYVGAYNSSQNLTGGNWTSSGAYVALDEAVGVEYGAYVIVNASTPSAGTRYVQVDAAELRAEHIAVAASGTFPVAGNYSANATIPLAPQNFSLAASVATLDLAAAYLNFSTGPNGSLALANEHVVYAEGINISLDAQQFPNVTRDAAGNVNIRYVTGAIVASAWLVENLTASFSPALPLVQGPLTVGKSWNATSTASFNGTVAWAETVHATSGSGATGAVSNSGSASAHATVPVVLQCSVLGTTVVRDPNGNPETDDVIACANATGSEAYLATNGLVVLPTSNPGPAAGLNAAVPVHPATAPVGTAARATGASLYSPSRHLAASERASPATGDQVTASPMTVSNARTAMHGLGTPVRPAPIAPHTSAILAVVVVGGSVAVALGLVALLARRNRVRP
ncbi:MAG: hypothetical protein L3K01_08360, partial [Thermoplasmata archaeon]|nr:hypothetical protein [Thermoplasmata archaeon]